MPIEVIEVFWACQLPKRRSDCCAIRDTQVSTCRGEEQFSVRNHEVLRIRAPGTWSQVQKKLSVRFCSVGSPKLRVVRSFVRIEVDPTV